MRFCALHLLVVFGLQRGLRRGDEQSLRLESQSRQRYLMHENYKNQVNVQLPSLKGNRQTQIIGPAFESMDSWVSDCRAQADTAAFALICGQRGRQLEMHNGPLGPVFTDSDASERRSSPG